MQVLVTGSSGFVGRRLTLKLASDRSVNLIAASRKPIQWPGFNTKTFLHGDLCSELDWREVLAGTDVVVHLAARVHVMQESVADPLGQFRRVNVAATARLAEQAAASGVRRFVYVSSIKVNGESTTDGHPFRSDDPPQPNDPYAMSKWESEVTLHQIAAATGMQVVIVRPPLVYGPGVGANFRAMMQWLLRGVPLPFGSIHNRRSLVALDNLSGLLVTCIRHPNAASRTFLAADGESVSTTQLLKRLARALGRPARLLPVPVAALQGAFSLFGKGEVGKRLCTSLEVDTSEAREVLGWRPTLSVDEGLKIAAHAFLTTR